MFSTEEWHSLLTSLDNLLCLKILYDCGYDIKSPSYWIEEYGSYSNEAGFNIFVDSIDILFTSCSDIEEVDDTYSIHKFIVHDTNLQRLIENKSSEDQEKFIRPFQQTYCDYTDSEMVISLNEKGLRLELHEDPLCYSNFTETLIELRRKIDELCSLM
ncbi:hypothetical protein ABHN05_11290 [Brevibacillus laterosporus]|uniref:hypothetical protein n=1 Tax=Brevibacillus laterosporus TaxID=1465 RepID=UPI001126829D|nr:hypothetical protein [Brevibacillus laterosporus]MBG9790525.1 hypothetical protein [Brevibacillus laterosporus]MBG9804946.1 hypothetical protein [Brevibacillus laterosporus]MED1786643.1 hypothetical protein [Brevibacillus laterosporus]MED4766149.1 hypothetical protein [Brevibacillus laterosporus]TPH15936.1 hypothetical protein EGH09_11315 [Brevibacillus laterosporus]